MKILFRIIQNKEYYTQFEKNNYIISYFENRHK